jgi:predicted AlkP superfamily pyrophosphatase or phosphodiesterase
MRFRRVFTLFIAAWSAAAVLGAAEKPKLVVAIAIDQFRYDYLTRFRADYQGGLDLLLKQGADFTNAHYLQAPTVTAVGHSIFLSGAMPAVSGIIGNAWYDRGSKKDVTSVCDWDYQVVGGPQLAQGAKCTDEDPASPRRLLVSTVGDELRDVSEDSRVIGISLKARASILPSGHRANAAFWFDLNSGNFVTSTYYTTSLPAWAEKFNSGKLSEQYLNKEWPGFPSWKFTSSGRQRFQKLPASPWGNELIEKFAEAALQGEELGQRGTTDLLTVSFSSNDYVGHAVGPDAPEVRDMAKRVDVLIGNLLHAVDEKVGLKNTIVVLTADHGVSPVPSVNQKRKMPGTYVTAHPADVVKAALNKKFGNADWIESSGEGGIYLNWNVIDDFKGKDGGHLTCDDVYRVAKEAVLNAPDLHAVRVYDREQLANGIAGDFIARAFVNGFFPRESPDLVIAYEPYAVPGSGHGTSHFSPYDYDKHVPILFMGPGIKAGQYAAEISPIDIAPTLATMLSIETPSGSQGRVLTEMLQLQ